MKILTKKQRHSYYKKALKSIAQNECWFICLALKDVDKRLTSLFCSKDIKEYLLLNYPELCSIKPKNVAFGKAWWNLDDKEKRISVLEQCIELTELKQLL